MLSASTSVLYHGTALIQTAFLCSSYDDVLVLWMEFKAVDTLWHILLNSLALKAGRDNSIDPHLRKSVMWSLVFCRWWRVQTLEWLSPALEARVLTSRMIVPCRFMKVSLKYFENFELDADTSEDRNYSNRQLVTQILRPCFISHLLGLRTLPTSTVDPLKFQIHVCIWRCALLALWKSWLHAGLVITHTWHGPQRLDNPDCAIMQTYTPLKASADWFPSSATAHHRLDLWQHFVLTRHVLTFRVECSTSGAVWATLPGENSLGYDDANILSVGQACKQGVWTGLAGVRMWRELDWQAWIKAERVSLRNLSWSKRASSFCTPIIQQALIIHPTQRCEYIQRLSIWY